MLRQYLSLQRVRKTGKWINVTGARESTEPIYLDVEACRNVFVRTRAIGTEA